MCKMTYFRWINEKFVIMLQKQKNLIKSMLVQIFIVTRNRARVFYRKILLSYCIQYYTFIMLYKT